MIRNSEKRPLVLIAIILFLSLSVFANAHGSAAEASSGTDFTGLPLKLIYTASLIIIVALFSYFMIKRSHEFHKKLIFDVKKIYASVYAATLNAHYSEKDAEMIASMVSKNVHKKACKKRDIDSKDIKLEVIHELNNVDKDIAFLYETHLDIN